MDSFAPIVRQQREGALVKFAQQLADGSLIESVIVPMRQKEPGKARTTLCVSTQVGCRMGCAFCATGRMGLIRNLTPEEICGQIDAATSLSGRPENLVFMGMGEPLDNFENLVAAIRRLIESRPEPGRPPMAYSTRDMIVSTCGLVPGIERLAAAGWKRLVLAVSLNAPNDEIRSRLMPVNRRHPMKELREALLKYPMRGGIFMAEYVLFRGVNDREEHARELAEYLRPFRACVNLIAWNPVRAAEGTAPVGGFESPPEEEVERFRLWLRAAGQYARRRESKGRDIAAGCGQLASGSEK